MVVLVSKTLEVNGSLLQSWKLMVVLVSKTLQC